MTDALTNHIGKLKTFLDNTSSDDNEDCTTVLRQDSNGNYFWLTITEESLEYIDGEESCLNPDQLDVLQSKYDIDGLSQKILKRHC